MRAHLLDTADGQDAAPAALGHWRHKALQ
jgi:hypothetical protein